MAEPLTGEARLAALLGHYEDSFSYARSYVATRNRLFVYTLIAFVAASFRASDAHESTLVLGLVANRMLGGDATIGAHFLGLLLWFVLFAFVARYFQAAVTVNQQYRYLHKLEDKLNALYGEDVFTREGKSYLNDYPAFSKWTHLVYTWLFPTALSAVIVWNLIVELRTNQPGGAKVIIIGIATAAIGNVAVYVWSTNWEGNRPR